MPFGLNPFHEKFKRRQKSAVAGLPALGSPFERGERGDPEVGRRLLRVSDKGDTRERRAEHVPLAGSSVYDEVLRTQKLVRAPGEVGGAAGAGPGHQPGRHHRGAGAVPHPGHEGRAGAGRGGGARAGVHHRHRPPFHRPVPLGQPHTSVSLAVETQRQLLPSASSCEAAEFDLAGALVPASDIAGDTYDYSLDQDTLHLSVTDAMGHDVDASLMATLLVNASRGARRAGADLAEQARQTHQALVDHGRADLCHRPARAPVPGRQPRPARQRRPPLAAAAARRQGRRTAPGGQSALRCDLAGRLSGAGPGSASRRPSPAAHRRDAGTRGGVRRSARPPA